jgi:natural product biosynthesis luciferase-like monooxygenase protein
MGESDNSDEISARISALSQEQRELLSRKLRQKGIAVESVTQRPETSRSNAADTKHQAATASPPAATAKELAFSLFFFSGNGETTERKKYDLIIECAKFADRHGFIAVWTPERHFKPFGGLYPNPSVLSAALSMVTQRIHLRAGSVVLPLQNPVRTAEEWSAVDNLSDGRVGVAFASGWHPDDFVLAPDVYPQRRELMFDEIQTIKHLWKGGAVSLRNGAGEEVEVRIYPNPLQAELPIWITAGSRETFVNAGRLGANVLTGLIEHGIDGCAEKIAAYRHALEENGHDPRERCVTVMLHTYVGEDTAAIKQKVRRPFCAYLRSFLQMSERQLSEDVRRDLSLGALDATDQEALLLHAFESYFDARALFGTPGDCERMINRLRGIGVDEVACLLDFGLDTESILEGLSYLNILRENTQRHLPGAA